MARLVRYTLVFMLVFTSCKTKKTVVGMDEELKEMSAKRIARKHIAGSFDKKTVDAKLKVNYKNSKESYGFSVKLRILKDNVIWIKGTKFITVFKAKITPVSVQYYSPLERKYFEGDFSMLEELLGVEINFQQLQNLLLGQAIYDLKDQKYTAEVRDKSYVLAPKEQLDLFSIFFAINPSHFKLDKQYLQNNAKGQSLDVLYPDYIVQKDVFFPGKIHIRAKEKEKFTNISIEVRSLLFDKDLDYTYRVPRGYKRIEI